MEAYKELHKRVTTGDAPPRYVVYKAEEDGLGDRVINSVTVFLFALLTNRAFQIHWEGNHSLHKALHSDYIDWRYTAPEQKWAEHAVWAQFRGKHEEMEEWYWRGNLTEYNKDAWVVYWRSNHGCLLGSFTNPWLRPKLAALGLTPHNAFACLFDMLFRPTPATLALYPRELSTLTQQNVLKLGIQIRTSDAALVSGKDNTGFQWQYQAFFKCAADVEKQMRRPGQKVVWFVVSSSVALRQYVYKQYGAKVVTSLEAEVKHISMDTSSSDHALMQAAGEMWLFSLADVHVISQASCFGRVGAVLSEHWRTFSIEIAKPSKWFDIRMPKSRRCDVSNPDHVDKIALDFIGV